MAWGAGDREEGNSHGAEEEEEEGKGVEEWKGGNISSSSGSSQDQGPFTTSLCHS